MIHFYVQTRMHTHFQNFLARFCVLSSTTLPIGVFFTFSNVYIHFCDICISLYSFCNFCYVHLYSYVRVFQTHWNSIRKIIISESYLQGKCSLLQVLLVKTICLFFLELRLLSACFILTKILFQFGNVYNLDTSFSLPPR